MAALPAGILSIRGPELSLGSPRIILDVGNRLRRMRGRFPLQTIAKMHVLSQLQHKMPRFWIQHKMPLGSSKYRRMRRRRLPDPRPIPEGAREPIYIRKK